MLVALVASAATLWCALVALPTSARADGDPASDVLATETLFLPQDAGVPTPEQGQLAELIHAAARSGYEIRVALIASSADLGSVTELWRRPQTYAEFLGQELSLVYRGPLLVVMPNGFGLYNLGSSRDAARSALNGVRIPTHGADLAGAALTAIQHLAAVSGHAVTIPPPPASSAGGRSANALPVIALVAGGVLIALAWGMSLRARPPRLPGGKPTPT